MKKYFLLLTFLFALGTAAQAQALIALVFGKSISTEKVQVGLFLAGQPSWITNSGSSMPDLGLAIGAYTNVELGEFGAGGWRFENYMVFKSPAGGQKLDVAKNSLIDQSIIDSEGFDKVQREVTYFELTPMMRYDITDSWAVGAGPVLGVRMLAKDTYSASRDDGTYTYTTSIRDKTSWINFGLAADLEFRLLKGNPGGLKINLRFVQGFTNMYSSKTTLSGKNIMTHLGVAIPIISRSKADVHKDIDILKKSASTTQQ